eukprot:44850-Eustigmatos_ZCMA.PRE.1
MLISKTAVRSLGPRLPPQDSVHDEHGKYLSRHCMPMTRPDAQVFPLMRVSQESIGPGMSGFKCQAHHTREEE